MENPVATGAGPVFVTGATGFIGRAFVREWTRGGRPRLRALVRAPAPAPGDPGFDAVPGRIEDPGTYAPALAGASAVLHLGAATGKRRPREYFRINVEGTKALLDAARAAGVPRFLFVSSIAALYPDKRRYPYARSKEVAEALVRESGLDWAIVRPTIVLGQGGPAWPAFKKLAGGRSIKVFGPGTARVQPIHVGDVARALAALLGAPRLDRMEFDLGGPDVMTFEEMLARIRAALGLPPARVVHLPAASILPFLSLAERILLPVLPFTAGQLTGFLADSTAARGPARPVLIPGPRPFDAIVKELAGGG